MNNLKQIGLALLNYEDKRHALPPISSNLDPVPDVPGAATGMLPAATPPGTAKSSAAGYSWIVFILPEIEEGALYQNIALNSAKFTKEAFDAEIVNGPAANNPHVAAVQLKAFLCPSFTGGATVDVSPRIKGNAATEEVETGGPIANYDAPLAKAVGAVGIAITNYQAILGTHIDDIGPAVSPYPLNSASLPTSNNGAMLYRGVGFNVGRKLAALTDGTSKTPLVAETRERRLSSWYDGTFNWLVAARHSKPNDGTKAITAANNTTTGVINGLQVNGRWTVGTDGTEATGGTALNYGPSKQNPTAIYLPADSCVDPDLSPSDCGRLWGPSSEHAGGIVFHVFGDCHVEGFTETYDPNVYLWVVTRNGGEPIPNLN